MYSSCAFFYDFTWFFILAKLNSFLSLDLSSTTWFFINYRYITNEFLKLTASEPKAVPFTVLDVMDFRDYSLKLSVRGAIRVTWLLLWMSYDKAFYRSLGTSSMASGLGKCWTVLYEIWNALVVLGWKFWRKKIVFLSAKIRKWLLMSGT